MKKLVPGILALSLTLAACGGMGGDTDAGRESPASPPAAAGATSVLVKLFRFQPERLEVAAGTTVTWRNEDQILHTVTAGTPEAPEGTFDEEMPAAGTDATVTFDEPGSYPYFCARHEHMRGTVVVA